MSQWSDVATLIKAKGSKGRFVARCASNLNFIPLENTIVYFVPPQLDAPREATVEHVGDYDGEKYSITFTGVDTLDIAERLIGCHVLVSKESLGDIETSETPGVMGYVLFDGETQIGIVSAILDNSGQMLLRVDREGDDSVLVPFVDAIVKNIDHDTRTLIAELPQGLLDL